MGVGVKKGIKLLCQSIVKLYCSSFGSCALSRCHQENKKQKAINFFRFTIEFDHESSIIEVIVVLPPGKTLESNSFAPWEDINVDNWKFNNHDSDQISAMSHDASDEVCMVPTMIVVLN